MKIVFDFDGTLVDSMPKLRALATNLISREYDIMIALADSGYMYTVGMTFGDQLNYMFPHYLEKNRTVAATFYDTQAEQYDSVTLHTGVLETIEFLNATPFRYAACSSTTGRLANDVIKQLIPEFKGVITGREYGSKQLQLESHLKHVDTPERWFIGDATFDGQVAKDVSTNFIGVTHTFPLDSFTGIGFKAFGSVPEAIDEVLRSLKKPLQLSLIDQQPVSLPESPRALEPVRSSF